MRVCSQEVKLKEDLCDRQHQALEKFKRKYALVRHMQSLLYEDFVKELQSWQDAKTALEKRLATADAKIADQGVHVEELAVYTLLHL